MAISYGTTSRNRMEGLHPSLVKVLLRYAEIAGPENDIMVVQGVRTREEMMVNYGKGRTADDIAVFGIPRSYAQPKVAKVTWLANPFKSNHGVQSDGFGHAYDVVPFVNGAAAWGDKTTAELARWKANADLMKQAAKDVGVRIVWGGDWTSTKDRPHFELA